MGSMGGGGGGKQDWTAANISKEVSRDIWETYKKDYTQWEDDLIAAATDTSADMADSDQFSRESVNSAFNQADNAFSMANTRMGVSVGEGVKRAMDRQTSLDKSLAMADTINKGRAHVDGRAMQMMAGGVQAKNELA